MLAPLLLLSLAAHAESWCAEPLWVHEWGVEVFNADGVRRPPPGLPASFYRGAGGAPADGTPVRDLPVDSGVRALPVLQFYAPRGWGRQVPVAIEVGFTRGAASAWYPQVDTFRSAADAHDGPALAARSALLAQRATRQPFGERDPLPADPTAQLAWEALTLTPEPSAAPLPAEQPWVEALRVQPALWVERGAERERFVFYEADTAERPALRVERGESWAPDRPHYVLHNASGHPVHDVLVLQDHGARSFYAPQIPAGAAAGFLLDEAQVEDPAALLKDKLVDRELPAAPADYRWDRDDCVMGRDPALPVSAAQGHRLFADEVEAILSIWGPRLLEQRGTVILYREDPAALDALMPLSIYTDMYHFVELSRLGLVLVEGVDLAAMSAEGAR
ncbi:MAG: hypothetical protein ABIO70_30070 [Pseudomonadota bacterium]